MMLFHAAMVINVMGHTTTKNKHKFRRTDTVRWRMRSRSTTAGEVQTSEPNRQTNMHSNNANHFIASFSNSKQQQQRGETESS